jgi:hypothetical protein
MFPSCLDLGPLAEEEELGASNPIYARSTLPAVIGITVLVMALR